MDSEEFRKRGAEMVDYVGDYIDSISQRRVLPKVELGYLRKLVPSSAPKEGESWDKIMDDVEKIIMPGVTHWQHPRFHAYFPSGCSYPSILAEMISDAIGGTGFSWSSSPASVELEAIVLDWLGKMIGLPDAFLTFPKNSTGGGVIQNSASDCTLVNLLAARHSAMKYQRRKDPSIDEATALLSLVGYCSREAHSSVEKASMIALTTMRILETDERYRFRGDLLEDAIKEDINKGKTPFFVAATIGTTSCTACDSLEEIGPICEKYNLWLHVDAAYAGSALICPEFRKFLKGIDYAMSFNMNPTKWMLVSFDCSTMWVKDRFILTESLAVDKVNLGYSLAYIYSDYQLWGIPKTRRFRSLKLWFVIRNYGIEGLQKYIREHVRLAKLFESFVLQDDRFELMNDVNFGLVCFRLKGTNTMNENLLTSINDSGKLHMIAASLKGKYVIRFCVCSQHATEEDIIYAWATICQFSEELLTIEKKRIKMIGGKNENGRS